MKLCLDYEVKKRNKVVKKERIVALKGELYFVKFNINIEEDDVKPGVILGRSFMRLAKGIIDFSNGLTTIYPKPDPFEEDSEKKEKSPDDWDQLLDFNFDDIPKFGEELPPLVCKIGKKEAAKEALAIRISQKFALLEEVRPVIERMSYHDKYKKIVDEIWKDKVKLDGKIIKEEDEAIERIKGEALKEKDDPGAFIFSIKLEGKVNRNALANTGSNINIMPYQIYETLGREEMKKVDRGITMINHTQAKAIGILTNVLCQVGVTTIITSDDEEEYQIKRNKFGASIYGPNPTRWREAGSDEEIFTSVAWIRAFNINEPIYTDLFHEFYSTYEFDEVCADDELQTKKIIKFRLGGRAHSLTVLESARRLGLYHAAKLDEEGFNVYFEGDLRSDEHFNAQEIHASTIKYPVLSVIHKIITYGLCQRTIGYDKIQKNDLWLLSMFHARHQNVYANVAWLISRWMKRKGAGTQKESQICFGQFISKITRKSRVLIDDVLRSLSAPIYCRDLDTTTLRELIDSKSRLIPEDPQHGVPRVGIPRPLRASMQDLYDRMGRMEIRQEAIERMEYRQ
uniref:Retrotransposon Orf1 n=1 Tax=Tanacetum cinerariifolium TaxID=118510 RepID=A0A6L2M5K1_TANCI|nr:retrotransposon Orf1 [Tanacetum cinerariifolium]